MPIRCTARIAWQPLVNLVAFIIVAIIPDCLETAKNVGDTRPGAALHFSDHDYKIIKTTEYTCGNSRQLSNLLIFKNINKGF
jgi:hypothetical protein